MSPSKTAIVNNRLNIPISQEIRSQLEELAERFGISLAELGRQALATFLAEKQRQERLKCLCNAVVKHSDIIEGTIKEWSVTEIEGWPDE